MVLCKKGDDITPFDGTDTIHSYTLMFLKKFSEGKIPVQSLQGEAANVEAYCMESLKDVSYVIF